MAMRSSEPVTQARLKELLHYDPETGVFTRRLTNRRWKEGTVAGCWSEPAGWVIRVDDNLYLAHRLAWLFMTGDWPKNEIDHIDVSRRNNRWENLREATGSQNKANKHKQSNNTSGFKGVSFQKGIDKYRARIRAHGRSRSLGCFDNPQDAHAAYVAAASGIWGEFARA